MLPGKFCGVAKRGALAKSSCENVDFKPSLDISKRETFTTRKCNLWAKFGDPHMASSETAAVAFVQQHGSHKTVTIVALSGLLPGIIKY